MIESPIGELLGYGLGGPEVDHIETGRRDDGGHTLHGRRFEPFWSGAEHPADQLVGPFGCGDVQHADDQALGDQAFHGPAAGTRGVEDEHFVSGLFEDGLGRLDANGRVAEHRGNDQRSILARRDIGLHHAANGSGGSGKDLAANAIDTCHVDNAGHHNDIFHADVSRNVGSGDGRDHDLGQTQRQGPHGGTRDRGPPAAAQSHDGVEPVLGIERRHERFGPAGHGGNGLAPVGLFGQLRGVGTGRSGNFLSGNVGRDLRRTKHTHVDQQGPMSLGLDALLDEPIFVPLGIQSAQ